MPRKKPSKKKQSLLSSVSYGLYSLPSYADEMLIGEGIVGASVVVAWNTGKIWTLDISYPAQEEPTIYSSKTTFTLNADNVIASARMIRDILTGEILKIKSAKREFENSKKENQNHTQSKNSKKKSKNTRKKLTH